MSSLLLVLVAWFFYLQAPDGTPFKLGPYDTFDECEIARMEFKVGIKKPGWYIMDCFTPEKQNT